MGLFEEFEKNQKEKDDMRKQIKELKAKIKLKENEKIELAKTFDITVDNIRKKLNSEIWLHVQEKEKEKRENGILRNKIHLLKNQKEESGEELDSDMETKSEVEL